MTFMSTSGEREQRMPLAPKLVPPAQGKRLQILAEIGFIKLSGAETAGLYAVMEGWTPPGAGPPIHRHSREEETFYVLEGEYEFTVGEQKLHGPAGSLVFGPRHIPHTFKNIGKSPARMLILAQPAGVEHFFEEMSDMVLASPPNPDKLAALASRYGIDFEI
jgi:quercetin dioxygenase-like cupin family protein